MLGDGLVADCLDQVDVEFTDHDVDDGNQHSDEVGESQAPSLVIEEVVAKLFLIFFYFVQLLEGGVLGTVALVVASTSRVHCHGLVELSILLEFLLHLFTFEHGVIGVAVICRWVLELVLAGLGLEDGEEEEGQDEEDANHDDDTALARLSL